MTKIQEIQVQSSGEGLPERIVRDGRHYRILAIHDSWRLADGWWGDETRRTYFRVEIGNGLVYDLYHDLIADRWYLTKMFNH